MAPTSPSDTALVRQVIRKLVERYFPGSQPYRFTDNVHRVIGVDDNEKEGEHDIRVFFPSEGETEETNPTFVTANFIIPRINTLEGDAEGSVSELSTKEQTIKDLLADLNRLICGDANGADIIIKGTNSDGMVYEQPRPKIRVSVPHQRSDIHGSDMHILIYGPINELASSIRRNVRLIPALGSVLSAADISM